MPCVVFIVLHYLTFEDTRECVSSIIEHIEYDNYKILIIDNASPNNSRQLLEKQYKENEKVKTIFLTENLGFAQGNNIGYQYAIENMRADFVIAINNDIIIKEKDFIKIVVETYAADFYHVLGPDIIDLNGLHQNPHRKDLFDMKRVKSIIRNRTIINAYLKLKKFLHLENRINFVEKWDSKRGLAEQSTIDWRVKQRNIVLQGSCYVFSPQFVAENTLAFCPDTFMGLEEEILAFQCKVKNYETLYLPDIQVIHKEQSSSKAARDTFERYIFNSQNLLRSAKVLYRLMKKESNNR